MQINPLVYLGNCLCFISETFLDYSLSSLEAGKRKMLIYIRISKWAGFVFHKENGGKASFCVF